MSMNHNASRLGDLEQALLKEEAALDRARERLEQYRDLEDRCPGCCRAALESAQAHLEWVQARVIRLAKAAWIEGYRLQNLAA